MRQVLVATAAVLCVCGVALGEIPQVMGYQGMITDNSGVPVTDGSYNMRFRIYDGESGGSLEWDSGPQSVQLTGGVFNVVLGESPQPALGLDFDEGYWLLVTFDGENQLPRKRLGSVGYAYIASGLVPGTDVIGTVPGAVIAASNTATTGMTFGLFGECTSPSGRGVVGEATAPAGMCSGVHGQSASTGGRGVSGGATSSIGITFGGRFESSSDEGRGVYGKASATTGTNYGVFGVSDSPSGRGVYGYATASSGVTSAGYFENESSSGRAVYGQALASTGTTYGVYGQSASTEGRGVCGKATSSSGTTFGGRFESSSDEGRGVYGKASATAGRNYGLFGVSDSHLGTGAYGYATASIGACYGVYGECASSEGAGVYGKNSSTVGEAYGVHGVSSATSGCGVFGEATLLSGVGITYGVRGENQATVNPKGVYGEASDTAAPASYGGYFLSRSSDGTGVLGTTNSSTGTTYGVRGISVSPSGYGGYFNGDVHVTGTLSKGGGSFLIDHPLDPENMLLRHNFVESPENLLIYRGKAQLDTHGEAAVEMPEYFKALTTEDEATVNLTPLGRSMSPTCYEFSYEWGTDYDSFEIYGQPGRQVAWMVMAGRDDPVMRQLARPVEEDKGPDNKYCDRGKLLYPTAYGHPESRGRDYERHERERQQMEEERARMEEQRNRIEDESARMVDAAAGLQR
jgi:hypothetical protein